MEEAEVGGLGWKSLMEIIRKRVTFLLSITSESNESA